MTISGGIRRVAVIAVAVVTIGGGAAAAYAAMSSSGPSYRLATVTSADVTASLNEVGTLTPEQQADAAFTVSGTIATVDVRAGQQVTAGQTLGTLDATPLTASLTAAQSALADANLKVANDIASQDNAAVRPAGSSPVQPSATASSAASSLAPLQQAVRNGQQKADAALAAAKTAETRAIQACAPSPAPSSSSASPGGASATPSPGTTSSAPPTCAAATQHVLSEEAAVLKDLQTLSGQENALSTALGLADGSGSSPHGTISPGGAGNPGGLASAGRLAADQQSADAAAEQVTVAQQDLAGARVVSPISGTVVSVNAEKGANASAGTTEFEVAELDSWQVQTQIPVVDMLQLKTGQHASVLPDGSTTALSGAVVTIGLQPAPNSNPVTYPVTIGLAGQPSGLHQGGYAAVTITTGEASGVSVPTSAVHYSGTTATATVYAAGKTRAVRIRVGTRGPVMTRVVSGLAIGQQVVLANLNARMPSNNPAGNFGVPGPIPYGGTFTVGLGGPGGPVTNLLPRAG